METNRGTRSRKTTSFQLSEDGKRLLDTLAQRYGVSRTAVIEVAIREKAGEVGIQWATTPPPALQLQRPRVFGVNTDDEEP